MKTKKLNTQILRKHKVRKGKLPLQMLTCYDFQTAELLNETSLDLILVGDSLGNVILGYDNTIKVSIDVMTVFAGAVKRGAPDKFVVADMPFGSYATFDKGVENGIKLFQESGAEALKLEGASRNTLQIIERLTEVGIPVMGHLGLTPQSVHQLGGYYTHGKTEQSAIRLIESAKALQDAGVFSIVLECVTPKLSEEITSALNVPTIGIGSGSDTDGQVLVINDLLKMGKERPPKFCRPVADLYSLKTQLIEDYLTEKKTRRSEIKAEL